MGLGVPLALLGLLAGLLPLLAHRVRRHDLPRSTLPTTRLLEKAVAAQRARRSLTDLLLLGLRIAVVCVACLALAAPYVTASLSFGDGRVASAVIVIDDSMSMMRTDGGRRLLQLAAARAAGAAAALPEGSEVALVLAGAPARVLLSRTAALAEVDAALSSLPEVSHRGDDLVGGVQLAVRQLGGASHDSRRILVLSDFAKHTRFDASTIALGGARLQLQRMGAEPSTGNLAITSAVATPDPTTPGQSSVAVEIAGHGELPSHVTLAADGAESIRVELASGGGRGVLHLPTPGPDDDPVVAVELTADDALADDNVRAVVAGRRDAVDILLINGDPQPTSRGDELFYARHALRLAPDDRGGMPRVRSVDGAALESIELVQFDIVVMANVKAPSGPTADRLLAFVRAGGGLWFAAGDHVEPQRYNARLGKLLPAHIRGLQREADVGLTAPEGAAQWRQTAGGLGRVAAKSRLMLESGGTPLLSFTDGMPALVSRQVGSGRVALLALPLDDAWSDLPLRPGYMPLLLEVGRHLAARSSEQQRRILPGDPVRLTAPPGASRMEVVAPGSERTTFDDVTAGAEVVFEDTVVSGAYRVRVAGADSPLRTTPHRVFTVVPPAGEADLRPLPMPDDEQLQAATEAHPVTVRRDLSPLVFLLVGALVAGEALLRRRRARG